jgi:hypothetical protein
MLFPLKFRATIRRNTTSRDASGQVIVDGYDEVEAAVPCLFLTTSGNKKNNIVEDFEANNSLYVQAGVDVHEGDIVVNIRTVGGSIIEAGPFQVRSAKEVPNHLTGKIHHISCKLVGVAG